MHCCDKSCFLRGTLPFFRKEITKTQKELSMLKRHVTWLILSFLLSFPVAARGEEAVVLSGDDLKKVVPTSFYFEGQNGPTQMRNAAAARFGEKRYVIVALVDTAGYSSDIRAKYEGFLITDSEISLGGKNVGAGAYGFGVTKAGQFNLFDLGGKTVVSVSAPKDTALSAPQPLSIVKGSDGMRLYRGRNYVTFNVR
jgi:hypothetical protein